MTSAAADRENRALEVATESILLRLADIKTSLSKGHADYRTFINSIK